MMLERRRQEDEAKYGRATLMLDAVDIRKHVQYDPQTQTVSGFVDVGGRLDETDVGSKAVVFVVAGPIGKLQSKPLAPGAQNTVVVEHALEELRHRRVRAVCMTMDGHASDVGMCNQPGCDLKSPPCEPLPGLPPPLTQDKVMVDAGLMLKLTHQHVAGTCFD